MKTKTLTLLGICVSLTCPTFGEVRLWADNQGRTLEAEYISATDETVKVRRTFDNQVFDIQLSLLSTEDVRFVLQKYRQGMFENEPTAHRELSRNSIPNFNQYEFEDGRNSCGPVAILNFIVWWDKYLYPDILEEGSIKDISIQIHADLVEFCDAYNGTNFREFEKGLRKFFEVYAPQYEVNFQVKQNPSPEWLSENTDGSQGIALLHGYYERDDSGILQRESGHYTSLAEIRHDRITVLSLGEEYKLKLSPVDPVETDELNYFGNKDSLAYQTLLRSGKNDLTNCDAAFIETALLFQIRRQ